MEEKIRLIWDFRGPDCEKIAKHYKIHLSDFLKTNNSVYFDFNDKKITALHHIVYLIVLKSSMKYFRDNLKPHRGEIAIQN